MSLPGDYRFGIAQVRHLGPGGLQTPLCFPPRNPSAASSGPWVASSYGDCLEILHLTKSLLFRLPVRASQLGFGAQHRPAVQLDDRVRLLGGNAH
ncbi:MAG: hypothetical protein KIS61_33390 [Candidatus Eremiobacteraeota bacterium]|nr:hypothetical protein [Candidatus Eremiobacteraeota bacterium]